MLSGPGPFLSFRKGWWTGELVLGVSVSPPKKGAWRAGPSAVKALLEGQTEKTQVLLSCPSAPHRLPPPYSLALLS